MIKLDQELQKLFKKSDREITKNPVPEILTQRVLKIIEEQCQLLEPIKNEKKQNEKITIGKVAKPFTKDIITDGNHISYFKTLLGYKHIQSDHIIKKASEVVENIVDLNEKTGERIGLMFGRIQSGKTNGLIASLAMAADNKYKCFIVLTSDNLWLYQQTISRLRQSLPGITVVGKDDWEHNQDSIKTKLGLNGVVFVSTKNVKNLKKLNKTLKDINAINYVSVIFDDEADQASLNTNIGKDDDDPSMINALINELRNTFLARTYIQVTATPQALFLQGLDSLYRPEFTVLVEPGKGYVGGETFFSDEEENSLLSIVPNDEIDILTSDSPYLPIGLKYSICWFYVGATVKLLRGEGSNFTFLCHVSLKKSHHENVRKVIQDFTDTMAKGLFSDKPNSDTKKVSSLLQDAYEELLSQVKIIPSFDEIINKLKFIISSTDIQVLNTDLKSSSGEPRYDNIFNILIGGTKLGRGVTIEGLLVTYYGRQTKKPQMDTVLQHARMYGYRLKDLDVSRVFLPQHLAERFRLIYESETNLREIINDHKDEGLRGIWLSNEIKPTRSNVLDPNEIGAFAAGKAYFPHFPAYKKATIYSLTSIIDSLLAPYSGNEYKKVSIDIISDVLKYTRTLDNSPGLWREERILMALEKLKQQYSFAYLSVKEGRNLSKPNNSRGLRSVYSSTDLNNIEKDLPTLLMLKQNGHGWDGIPFWIPVFRFPEGNYAFMFSVS